jgi:GT2 family glycosyltransferase
MPNGPAVSVVICAYTDERWAVLSKTIESVRTQAAPPEEVLLVVDHNPELLSQARESFPATRVLANEGERGLSGARNTGVRHCRGEIVAFLDDDATAHPDWLKTLVRAFDEPSVMGAGGAARPIWDGGQHPRWLPSEFLWVVGASYEGLPRETAEVRNPIGANMAFRRRAFEAVGGFTDGIGRVGRTPLGCEETEFSIRLLQGIPGALILYLPEARVDHHVAPDRATWRYFVSRCWAEGISKALVAARVGEGDGLSSERSYVARTLPAGVLGGLRDARRGDRSGLLRAAAIILGLGITGAGFVRGSLRPRSPRT